MNDNLGFDHKSNDVHMNKSMIATARNFNNTRDLHDMSTLSNSSHKLRKLSNKNCMPNDRTQNLNNSQLSEGYFTSANKKGLQQTPNRGYMKGMGSTPKHNSGMNTQRYNRSDQMHSSNASMNGLKSPYQNGLKNTIKAQLGNKR